MFAGVSHNKRSASVRALLKSIAAFTLVWLSHGLSADTSTAVKSALTHSVSGFELSLDNGSATCQLQTKETSSAASKTIPLLLESPCYWIVSNNTQKLLEHGYEAVEVDKTLLVAGTPLDWPAEKKSYQKLPENTYCSQYLQGIVISKKDIFAVDEKMLGAHCETGMAIDEKIFYAMAHNPKRYQEKVIEKAAEIKTPDEAKTPVEPEGKSLFDSVTDSIKSFFSGKSKDAK